YNDSSMADLPPDLEKFDAS
ncbi:hypothetical protein Tco_1020463, partial [Tanacetum coccineum]